MSIPDLFVGQRVVVSQLHRIASMRGEAYIVSRISPNGCIWARPDKKFKQRKRVNRGGKYEYETVETDPCWEIAFGADEIEPAPVTRS